MKVDRAKVRALLEERGMSQREFAEISGVAAASTLQALERGETVVRLTAARKVAGCLEVEPKSLGRPVHRA